MFKVGLLKNDSAPHNDDERAPKCKRRGLRFWDRHDVWCPSIFRTIKRSKHCSGILYTSGAHIPPAGSWKCYCNRDDMAGLSPVWQGEADECFPWDSEWLDLSVIASMSGTFPSGWKETFPLFFSLQRLLYFMQRGKVMRLSACSHILSAMRLLFL